MNSLTYQKLHIDFLSQEITTDGKESKLDPKAFKTLKFLIENKHRVVTSDELIEKVWDNRQINNDVVVSAVGRIRKLFKDADIQQETIHTVHKVGYRFTLNIDQQKNSPTKSSNSGSLQRHKILNGVLVVALIICGYVIFSGNYFTDKSHINPKLESAPETAPVAATEIFFLRHAEKEFDGSDNPHLSEVGKKRSLYWKKFFQYIKFDEVYSTQFYRNIETAEIVLGKDAEVIHYSALSFDIMQQLNKIRGKKILIIGHSNTIPGMVNRLLGNSQYPPMSHENYDLIYQVNIDSSGFISSNQFYIELESASNKPGTQN